MALQGKANQNDKVLITGRTNSTKTADTASISFKHDRTQGYKTRIGSDTDYSTADDSTADRRRDSNLKMGSQGLVRSGGTGGNVKEFKTYTEGKDIFTKSTDSTSLAIGAHGQLLYVDGGSIKAKMNNSTSLLSMSTNAPILTAGGGAGANGDTSPGLDSFNSSIVYYTKINAQAGVTTNTLSYSTSR